MEQTMTEEITLLLLARWTRNLLALVGAYHVGRHIFLPGLVHFVNRCKDIERGDVEALREAIARGEKRPVEVIRGAQ
jgi:hypothetical protein